MTRLVSLAAGTILDASPADAVGIAARAGFGAVGIWYDHEKWTPQTPRLVREQLDSHGIVALDIEPIMLSSKGDFGNEIVDAAQEIGVHNILVASREGDPARVAARLHELAERLGYSPIKLVLEFLPVLAIKTFAEAVAIVRSVAHPAVGVLIDSLHLARSGTKLAEVNEVFATEPQLLPYLQICDAPLTLSEPTFETLLYEALHGRLLPGDGDLPVTELLRAVMHVPVSLEVRSEALRTTYPDPNERARVVFAATSKILSTM